jgi:hypothetical protein
MNARLEIINAMTESGAWLERVQEEMGHGKEILLVLSQIDQAKSNALAKLCHAYRYSQEDDTAFELSHDYRHLLDLHDYAAKEHGIASEMVFLLHPQSSQSTRHHLGA